MVKEKREKIKEKREKSAGKKERGEREWNGQGKGRKKSSPIPEEIREERMRNK